MTTVAFPPMSAENPAAVGVVATWYARDGEQVAADQLIAEVQMDKTSLDVFSPHGGTIHLVVEEGAEVVQGAPIAHVT